MKKILTITCFFGNKKPDANASGNPINPSRRAVILFRNGACVLRAYSDSFRTDDRHKYIRQKCVFAV